MNKNTFSELHSLEFDILNSECRDCYLNHLECTYYKEGCRK